MRVLLVCFCSLLFITPAVAAEKAPTIKSFIKEQAGKEYFLKIDLVEVNFGLRGVDAANVMADGTVSHRARVNLSQIQAQSGEDFAEDARVQIAKDCYSCAVRRVHARQWPAHERKYHHCRP